jgi:pyruvate/2-oxoglutarate dehydrogenase complex dihydrolipoamide dehydrogenase (E3) component
MNDRNSDGLSLDSLMPALRPLDEHNRRLLSNAHPPDWVNPEPAGRYNLIVIGAGAGGLVSSIGAATLGAKVALIERNLLGGDCLNVGCVPSKALIRSARAYADVRDAGEFGIRVDGPFAADFPAVMERMRRLRADISPADGVGRLRAAGVDVFLGTGRFTGPETIEVAGKTLCFSRAIIATGGRPAIPAIPGLAEAEYLSNETVFGLTELPRRLAVLGAGPVGCELSQAFARFGAEVHLIQKGQQILPREDADAAEIVRKAMERDGVRMRCGSEVTGVRLGDGDKVLTIAREGAREELRVDAILVAAGRHPNVEGLGLEAADVRYEAKSGVTVDDRMRTSNRRVYGVGDVCFPYHFTHASDATARLAIRNALFFGRASAKSLVIPWCTYTDPEVAHVGLNEREAAAKGIAAEVIRLPLSEVDRAILDGEIQGFLTVLVRKRSDKVLGATLVAGHAGELISQITLAMTAGMGLKAIADTIYPYPTQAEVIRRAADAYMLGQLKRWGGLLGKFLAYRR